jgi:hypothetical protein
MNDAYLLELEKVAARLRALHATTGPWKELRASAARPAPYDPNPRGLYLAPKRRDLRQTLYDFARARREGTPRVVEAVIDTNKARVRARLSPLGERRGVTQADLDDALEVINDKSLSRMERGEAWRLLNENAGAFYSPDGVARVLRTLKY